MISELRRSDKANRDVAGWAATVPVASFFLSAISILEIELGTLLIARRDVAQGAMLRQWIDQQILPGFEGRILAVDTVVAQRCGNRAEPSADPVCVNPPYHVPVQKRRWPGRSPAMMLDVLLDG